jgi:hypothetical protein
MILPHPLDVVRPSAQAGQAPIGILWEQGPHCLPSCRLQQRLQKSEHPQKLENWGKKNQNFTNYTKAKTKAPKSQKFMNHVSKTNPYSIIKAHYHIGKNSLHQCIKFTQT